MKVKVYKNLHKKCWSVLGPEGRVIDRPKRVVILDADFIVRPGGRQRFRETGHKIVHAFVVGQRTEHSPYGRLVPVAYNPRLNETFIRCDTGEPIYCAKMVVLETDGQAYAQFHDSPKPPLKTINFLLHHRHAILSPKSWCELLNVTIYDDDGWREDEKSFDDPLGLEDFLNRFCKSTVRF